MSYCGAAARPRPGVIWCGSHCGSRSALGWSFPARVEAVIKEQSVGTVLHLFGGRARFGTRLDVDPVVRPDVIGDAWLPPFGAGSFGTVVLDPPYWRINHQEAGTLLAVAAMIASDRVIWLHTVWLPKRYYLEPVASWLVRVGDFCQARCLQVFRPVPSARLTWPRRFTQGPAIKYNKWLAGERRLPFPR